MIWLRNRLRAWLGIDNQEKCLKIALERADMALSRIGEIEKLLGRIDAWIKTDNREVMLGRLAGLDVITQAHADELIEIRKVAGEMRTALHQLNEVREAIEDPKHRPVIAKTMRQYRALMEQDV